MCLAAVLKCAKLHDIGKAKKNKYIFYSERKREKMTLPGIFLGLKGQYLTASDVIVHTNLPCFKHLHCAGVFYNPFYLNNMPWYCQMYIGKHIVSIQLLRWWDLCIISSSFVLLLPFCCFFFFFSFCCYFSLLGRFLFWFLSLEFFFPVWSGGFFFLSFLLLLFVVLFVCVFFLFSLFVCLFF